MSNNATFPQESRTMLFHLHGSHTKLVSSPWDSHGRDHVKPAVKQLHWLLVQQRTTYKLCLFMHLIHNGQAPQYLSDCVFTVSAVSHRHWLRSSGSAVYVLPRTRTRFGERGFFLLRSGRLEHPSFGSPRHYWYQYFQKTTQECTFWLCLPLTIVGAPGRVI